MSIEAMTYVLSLNVGDSTRKLILVGYANHAHRDGTGAWASPTTVGEYADCSGRTVQRHLSVLLTEGYMREGEQRLVAHIPADRRPIVYDIAMSEATRQQWKASYEPGRRAVAAAHGRRRGATSSPRRGDTLGTPDVTPVTPRGVTRVTERGDTAMSPEPSLNRPSEPSKEPSETRRRRPVLIQIPQPFAISDRCKAWAAEKFPRVPIEFFVAETEHFVGYHLAKANRYADWDLAWMNWMRRAAPKAMTRQPPNRLVDTGDTALHERQDAMFEGTG